MLYSCFRLLRYNCKDGKMSTNKIIILLAVVLFGGTACSRDWFVTHNGNMPSEERISQIEVGSDKTEVSRILGAPSSVVSFDRNTWIYMSADVERIAFFSPKEISRDVLTVRFNDDDKVIEITRLDKEDGKEISVSSEKTETFGQRPGFFERFFGGIGTYAPFPGMNQSAL